MRTILFTGKGGVGKTTVAAATAVRCADAGLRTVVMSTDPAHSLADSFDVDLNGDLTEVAPHCLATQLDASARLEERWGDIRGYLREVFDWAGLDQVEAEELSLIPGLEEIFALTDITDFARSGDVDVLVVDCAPTAETIRFLSLPDVLSWYMDRAFPVSRRLTQSLGPLVHRLAQVPVAGDAVFGAAERLYQQLDGVREILRDGDRSTVRLVLNPERMVIAEARRTYTYLSLFGYRVDAVVANRVLPDAVVDPWFDRWKESQAEHLETIDEGFAPLPIICGELASAEIVGLAALRNFAEHLYADRDASSVLIASDPLRVTRDGDELMVRLELPFAQRDDLEVTRSPTELFVKVGPYRRAVLLPDSLRRREVVGAALVGGVLEVQFG